MSVRSDDDLRARVRELGRAEEDAAPGFEGLLARPPLDRRGPGAWLRPAAAVLGACAVAAGLAWWRPVPRTGEAVGPSPRATVLEVPEDWGGLPTDGLLQDPSAPAAGEDVDRLSREIEGLLRP
jgi:hypothetical protein